MQCSTRCTVINLLISRLTVKSEKSVSNLLNSNAANIMTDSKPDVLVVNNFHPPTISRIDKIYQTHHLWKLNTKAQNELIAKLDGKCKAAVTGSWTFNERAYNLRLSHLCIRSRD